MIWTDGLVGWIFTEWGLLSRTRRFFPRFENVINHSTVIYFRQKQYYILFDRTHTLTERYWTLWQGCRNDTRFANLVAVCVPVCACVLVRIRFRFALPNRSFLKSYLYVMLNLGKLTIFFKVNYFNLYNKKVNQVKLKLLYNIN